MEDLPAPQCNSQHGGRCGGLYHSRTLASSALVGRRSSLALSVTAPPSARSRSSNVCRVVSSPSTVGVWQLTAACRIIEPPIVANATLCLQSYSSLYLSAGMRRPSRFRQHFRKPQVSRVFALREQSGRFVATVYSSCCSSSHSISPSMRPNMEEAWLRSSESRSSESMICSISCSRKTSWRRVRSI